MKTNRFLHLVLQVRSCQARIRLPGIMASIILGLASTPAYSQEKAADTEERIRKLEEAVAVKAVAGDAATSTDHRHARLYTSGEINQGIPVHYILQMEFAGGDVRFADAYLGVSKIPYVGLLQLGQMYEPFSLEQLTSDNYVTFMERAAPIETFSPSRNLGVMALNTAFDERL